MLMVSHIVTPWVQLRLLSRHAVRWVLSTASLRFLTSELCYIHHWSTGAILAQILRLFKSFSQLTSALGFARSPQVTLGVKTLSAEMVRPWRQGQVCVAHSAAPGGVPGTQEALSKGQVQGEVLEWQVEVMTWAWRISALRSGTVLAEAEPDPYPWVGV